MESVYAEVQTVMLEQIQPIRLLPIEGTTQAERLDRLIDRRTRLFEEILPIKIAADTLRQRSQFLAQDHVDMVRQLRDLLASVLSEEACADQDRFEALDALLSVDLWRRLRQDQALAPADATRVLRRAAHRLLA
jgi:hypothetical protein